MMDPGEYYDNIAFSYNELHGLEQKKKLGVIRPFLDSDSILDVGCATGIASPKGAVGVDPSKELLKLNKGIAVLGNAERLPFADKSFDIITCLTVIHHCDVDKSLREFLRVANKKIIVSVLKGSDKFDTIVGKIKSKLNVVKEIKEEKDLILIAEL
jgi:ubiquinone/menaquinone biosynthesis C-methylase UbiE